MGLFSRSVKFGPLRVNASKSGLGLSAGVKGARVSVGPRGTYVTLGRGGFRYRTKLDGPRKRRAAPRKQPTATISAPPPPPPSEAARLDEGWIHTASTAELAEASPDTVLEDIQKRVHRYDWFKIYVIVVCVLGLPFLVVPPALLVLAVLAAIPGYFIYRWNYERRTARLFYDVDNEDIVLRLSACNAVGEALSRTAALWHIYASVATSDTKRNAGANTLIQRTPTSCHPGSLPGIELNIEPWSITVGPQQLLFLPDRLLVHENNRFAAVPYDQLSAEYAVTNFVEEDRVPPDAHQVDVTWRYVNKSGGPDRRFNNNYQIPVLAYGRLTLTTPTGLTILLQSSNVNATRQARDALVTLRRMALEDSRGVDARALDSRDQGTFPTSRTVPALSQASSVPSPSAPHGSVLREAATVLRFIAAADRKISDEEVEQTSSLLTRLFGDPSAVAGVMTTFKQISSSDADVRRAVHLLAGQSDALVRDLLSGAEAIALADGRVTPKEEERLSQLKNWVREATRASA